MITKNVGYIALSLFFFQACAPTYFPNAVHSPMLFSNQVFDEKDVTFGAYLGTSGVDGQLAFAMNKSFAMMFNTAISPRNKEYSYFGEVGIGNYHNFGRKQQLHFEIYGGGGLGFAKSIDSTSLFGSPSSKIAEGNYSRFFIQPVFGLNKAAFETSIAVRTVLINHSKYIENSVEIDVPNAVFFEPAFNLRFGFGGEGFFENKKLSLQLGLPIALDSDKVLFDYEPIILNLGFIWRPKRDYEN